MLPNRKIGEKQDEMGRLLGKNGCKQASKESIGGKKQGRRKRGRPQLRWEDCVRRDMRRSGEDESWREGATDRKLLLRFRGGYSTYVNFILIHILGLSEFHILRTC